MIELIDNLRATIEDKPRPNEHFGSDLIQIQIIRYIQSININEVKEFINNNNKLIETLIGNLNEFLKNKLSREEFSEDQFHFLINIIYTLLFDRTMRETFPNLQEISTSITTKEIFFDFALNFDIKYRSPHSLKETQQKIDSILDEFYERNRWGRKSASWQNLDMSSTFQKLTGLYPFGSIILINLRDLFRGDSIPILLYHKYDDIEQYKVQQRFQIRNELGFLDRKLRSNFEVCLEGSKMIPFYERLHVSLNRLVVENYFSIDKVDLQDLGPINVIIGKNKSGKTNLLKVIENYWKLKGIFNALPPDPSAMKNFLKTGEPYVEYHWRTQGQAELLLRRLKIEDIPINPTSTCHIILKGNVSEILWMDLIEITESNEVKNLITNIGLPIARDKYQTLVFESRVVCIPQNRGKASGKELKKTKQNFDNELIIQIRQSISSLENSGTAFEWINNLIFRMEDSKRALLIQYVMDLLNIELMIANVESHEFELHLKYKEDSKLYEFGNISHGSLEIILMLTLLIQFDGTFLIDEPERGLHPSLQRKFFKILEEIARTNNNQIFIATHSPIFAALCENVYILSRGPLGTVSKMGPLPHLIKSELGAKNLDVLVPDLFLFTEDALEDPIRILFQKSNNGLSFSDLNIAVMPFKGVGNVKNLLSIQFFHMLDENNIPYLIIGDKDVIEQFGSHFRKYGLHQVKILYFDPDFEGLFSEIQLLKAIKAYCEQMGYMNISLDEKQIKSMKPPIYKSIHRHLFEIDKIHINKRDLGHKLAETCDAIPSNLKELFETIRQMV